jgi:hypothetical protein
MKTGIDREIIVDQRDVERAITVQLDGINVEAIAEVDLPDRSYSATPQLAASVFAIR